MTNLATATVQLLLVDLKSDDSVELLELPAQGPPGPPGQAGSAGATFFTRTAAQALGGHRVVRTSAPGVVDYVDTTNVQHANSVLGITTGAAAQGAAAYVQRTGEITEPSWNWALGTPVFAGPAGTLTQTPAGRFAVAVGIPTSATSIVVQINPPIVLG